MSSQENFDAQVSCEKKEEDLEVVESVKKNSQWVLCVRCGSKIIKPGMAVETKHEVRITLEMCKTKRQSI